MNEKSNLYDVQKKLMLSGYEKLAGVVGDYIEKAERHGSFHIGIVGDDLVGKSAVINAILNEKIIPETVLPSSAEISVKYGKSNEIRNQNNQIVEGEELLRLIEDDDAVSIVTPNEFLRENKVEIKEFHGLLSKQKMSDMFWMSSIYKCDAVVVVMSAEHLLSENECSFINNYIQYVGENHLLLVVNKLASVAENDVEHVLKYAQKQIEAKFPKIKWAINNIDDRYSGVVSKYTNIGAVEGIKTLCGESKDADSHANDNLISFVRDELHTEIENLKEKRGKSSEEIKISNQRILEQKELEKATIEEELLEFTQRRNTTVEKVDSFIKKEFANISDALIEEYDNSKDKCKWYDNELEKSWKHRVSSASERSDDFIGNMIVGDVKWLNHILDTSMKSQGININIPIEQLNVTKVKPYGAYRKYVPIGMGGGIVIGYCLFRLVGAVIGLGGGMLAFSYLKFIESSQDEEIKRGISSQVRDISSEVRKLTRIDIEKIYDGIIAEFKKEVDNILDSKFRTIDGNSEELDSKISELQMIISKMEV